MDEASKSGATPQEPVFEVPIQTLEEALGRELVPDGLKDIDPGMEDCERLYNALYAYHQNNRIQPVTTPNTVRPNLSFVSLAQGVRVERANRKLRLSQVAAGTHCPVCRQLSKRPADSGLL